MHVSSSLCTDLTNKSAALQCNTVTAQCTTRPAEPDANTDLLSVVWQRSATLQVGLDLLRVGAVCTLQLAVEVLVAVVDGVHVLVVLVAPPPAVRSPLRLPASGARGALTRRSSCMFCMSEPYRQMY